MRCKSIFQRMLAVSEYLLQGHQLETAATLPSPVQHDLADALQVARPFASPKSAMVRTMVVRSSSSASLSLSFSVPPVTITGQAKLIQASYADEAKAHDSGKCAAGAETGTFKHPVVHKQQYCHMHLMRKNVVCFHPVAVLATSAQS